MKTPLLMTAFLLLAGLGTWAAEPDPFELHAVAKVASDHTREYAMPERNGHSEKVLLDTTVLLDHTALKVATLEHEADGTLSILVKLTEAGRKRFGEITTEYLDRRIGIVLAGKLQSAPVVRSPMLGGALSISGNFTEDEAIELANKLNESIIP